MKKNSYAIIGTGGVGGYIGACLARAGFDTHFLLHRDYQHVRMHGLKIDSSNGNFVLPNIQAYDDITNMPRCDVVLLTLMHPQNYLIKEKLPQILMPDGAALVLQNGIGVEEEIAAVVGNDKVLGGAVHIKSNKVAPGYIKHSAFGLIEMAEFMTSAITPRLQQIAADIIKSGIEVNLQQTLATVRWKKLLSNVPFNSLQVILNTNAQQLIRDENSRQLILTIMEEILLAARSYDCKIEKEYFQTILTNLADMTSYSSMKLAYDNKQPIEVEAIVGNPLRLAAKKNITLPHVAVIYRQLLFLDRRNIHRDPLYHSERESVVA